MRVCERVHGGLDVGEQELVTLDDIRAAKQRLLQNKLVVRTPLLREVQAMFPGVEDIRLHLKLENMQTAGNVLFASLIITTILRYVYCRIRVANTRVVRTRFRAESRHPVHYPCGAANSSPSRPVDPVVGNGYTCL